MRIYNFDVLGNHTMAKKNIILTGFMGTGKSTLGRLLAEKLDYSFIDTDSLIEDRIGQTIANLFKEQGEAAFRKLEENLVQELAQQQGLVISTGGGLILNPKNVETFKKSGQIICLTATPAEILERVSSQNHIRPLLLEKDPLSKIKELLEQRSPVYSQFQQLLTSGKNPHDLVKRLIELTYEP
jgi:shikimate kinase